MTLSQNIVHVKIFQTLISFVSMAYGAGSRTITEKSLKNSSEENSKLAGFYILITTKVGWGAINAIRDIMTEHTLANSSGTGNRLEKIAEALEFATDLLSNHSAYGQLYPQVLERAKALKNHGAYLAHEFFNRDWHQFDFPGMNL